MREMHLPLVVTVALLAGIAAPVWAQEPEPPSDAPGNVTMNPGQVQQLFDAMVVMQSQQALELNEQQYAQFLTRLRLVRASAIKVAARLRKRA